MKIIGLTGNSGSGKSTVALYLNNTYNAYAIDADHIGHIIISKGMDAYNEIIKCFGTEILNKNQDIDRQRLGTLVFNDEDKLIKLTKITHFYICKEMVNQIRYIQQYRNNNYTSIIIDAALLLQTELKKYVDEIWVVFADMDKRIERLMQRQNLTKQEVKKRIHAQWTTNQYKKLADVLIDNTYSFENTMLQCDKAYKEFIFS